MEIIFRWIAAPLVYPLLSLIPAAIFLAFFLLRIRAAAPPGLARFARRSLWAGLAWVAYTVYELRMAAWSKTVSGAIRVDLFLVWPALFLLSAFAVVGAVRLEKEARGTALPESTEGLDRRVARRWALVIVGYSVLNALILVIFGGGVSLLDGWLLFPLALNLGLAYFLARGYPWARWLLALRCAIGVYRNLSTGVLMLLSGRSDLKLFGAWALASAIVYAVVGRELIFSKRLVPAPPLVAAVRGR